jgi:hydroxymethylpyrimidine/phosphomethylpyrimidine kinase
MHTVLTIAGSDSSAGAGIQADLKTIAALGAYGMSAITALTAQNTLGVTAVHRETPKIVGAQIDAVFADIVPDAVKIGMLGNAAIIEVVAQRAEKYGFQNLVVDPLIQSTSGQHLLTRAMKPLRERLLPLARVVTPNAPEAEALVQRTLKSRADLREAAAEIQSWGPKAVVITGGHIAGDDCTDLLYDGRSFKEFTAPRIATTSTHGTGCTFASAIAVFLANGDSVPRAVKKAKDYLTEALRQSHPLGQGYGPINHFWKWVKP